MAPDPHIQIRHRLDKMIGEARKNAVEKDQQDIKNLNLDTLSAEKQIEKLISTKDALKQEADCLEKKEYYRLDRYDPLISILYLSRLICLNTDDEQAIRNGILLNVKEQHIDLLLSKAKEQLKPFSFEDYLANHSNIVFYDLEEKPITTSDEDYENIRAWQINKKIDCVKLEFNQFRENFKKAVKDEINIHESLWNEIKLLQDILTDADKWKAKQFNDQLKKLKGLSEIILPEDISEMHQSFCLFLKGNNFINRLSPRYFETSIKSIKQGKMSQMPIVGLSLFMYFRWLQHICQFREMAFIRDECSFDTLFENTFKEGQQQKNISQKNVKKKIMDRSFNDRHYERVITKGMEEQRKIFNQLKYPHYFTFLEQKELLKNCFIEDCLRSMDIELAKVALKETIILNENIQFYSEELCLLKHHPLTPSADQLSEIAVMTETLCHMAPDSELINHFLNIRMLINKQVYDERIPLFFICENANSLFTEIFEDAIKNFKKLIENFSIDEKGLFISGLLRDINYMETINGIKCIKKNIFFKQFKHILKNELKNVHEMQSFKPKEVKDNGNKKEKDMDKPINFGYRKGPKELRPIVKAMELQMNLFAGDTTAEDFMEVLMCKDLSKCKKKIHLGLKTNLFYYFREKCKPWAKYFTPACIEKSGIFISLSEGVINAHLLYNSKSILKEDSDRIDAIFNATYR